MHRQSGGAVPHGRPLQSVFRGSGRESAPTKKIQTPLRKTSGVFIFQIIFHSRQAATENSPQFQLRVSELEEIQAPAGATDSCVE
jgi:hypothetical protein